MFETPLTSQDALNARPTLRVDKQENERVAVLFQGMWMTESEGGMSALEVRFSNVASDMQGSASLAFEDDAVLKLGASMSVYAGDVNAPREIFQGTITGLEADFPEETPPELVVLAEDVFQRARMARRTRVYDNAKISDIANQLASKLNLTPRVTGFTNSIGVQVQLNESDLAFLRRLLNRYDGDVQVVGGELHVSPRSQVQRNVVNLELHSQLRCARVLADLAHQVTQVTVAGWDAAQGQRITGESSGANLGPGTGRTGAEVLQQSLGDRSQHIAHLAAANSAEAQAIADAAFDRRARRMVCVEGTASGNPALRVGTHVSLSGLGGRFDNTYYVVRAVHRYDSAHGYETDFEAECAYWGQG
jgi:phage protein D